MDIPLLEVEGLSHAYGPRVAIDSLSFSVGRGEVFGLLGPNGSGKTTLFRILATLVGLSKGRVRLGDFRLPDEQAAVRQQLGIVFQSPSLDKKLTVIENLRCQGHLYGLSGRTLGERIHQVLEEMAISDRAADLVETLSGGLARRVEIAKALLHRPALLLLDEPTTGVDPRARRETWDVLHRINQADRVTLLLTTHLMDDAEHCDKVMILDRGRRVALDTPSALKRSLGSRLILVRGVEPKALAASLSERFSLPTAARIVEDTVRIETPPAQDATRLLTDISAAMGDKIESITLAQPTLEDVFIRLTGRGFASREDFQEAHSVPTS
jgi:ABC-2 type transport system ATP-binding protein